MALAIKLAKKGARKVKSNPVVGCVIAKNGKIVATGYHKKFGEAHAEINAISKAGKKAKNAEMFVSLEPCNHFGKTPPCTHAIIKAGIRKVIIAAKDPNPVAAGGIKKLKQKKIIVKTGLLGKEAAELNRDFFKLVKTGLPYVTLKMAVTMDEKISWGNGRRKKITGKEADAIVQKMRAEHDAILVGINTVLKDNPRLTARAKNAVQPAQIVLDSRLRFPLNARMLEEKGETIIFATGKAGREKILQLESKGATVAIAAQKNGKIDLRDAMEKLGKMHIKKILVEGGAEIAAGFLQEKLVDEAVFFIAPFSVGSGIKAFGKKHREISERVFLESYFAQKLGNDTMIAGIVSY